MCHKLGAITLASAFTLSGVSGPEDDPCRPRSQDCGRPIACGLGSRGQRAGRRRELRGDRPGELLQQPGDQIKHFESRPIAIPTNDEAGATAKCPHHFKVLNAYFATDQPKMAPSFSAALGPRKWGILAADLSGDTIPHQLVVGIVLAGNVG
jgi:hypothetical protein